MHRCLLFFSLTLAAFAQSPDAVLTKTLIDEIHALRQNLEAATITSQRVQIVLFRLQAQTVLVNSAHQRWEATRTEVQKAQSLRNQLAADLQSTEEQLRNLQEPTRKTELERITAHFKQQIDAATTEESARRAAEAEAASQFRDEQARYAGLQATLDRLDKVLDEMAQPKR
jgi:chromosome segregation ATPase